MISIYWQSLLLCLAIQIPFYLIAVIKKTDKFTDFAYSLTFIIMVLWLNTIASNSEQITIVLILMSIWAVRIGMYLFFRIQKIKHDNRFDGLRESVFKFTSFWIYQAFIVWCCCLPVISLIRTNSLSNNINSSWDVKWMMLFLILWLTGFGLESISDWQKYTFKKKFPKRLMTKGLWKYSRHPNYLGEFIIWIAILLYIAPYLENTIDFSLAIGGIVIFCFSLYHISGVVLLEKKHRATYGSIYKQYKKNTAKLIPFIW